MRSFQWQAPGAGTAYPPNAWVQSPVAVLDYVHDLSAYLATGETISSVVWSIDSPNVATPVLVIASVSHATTNTTAFVSGGVSGVVYEVTVSVVTSAARTDARTILIEIVPT